MNAANEQVTPGRVALGGQMAGYVSFWDGGSGRWTVKSTQLAAWLAGGWRADFRLGDCAERDAIIDQP